MTAEQDRLLGIVYQPIVRGGAWPVFDWVDHQIAEVGTAPAKTGDDGATSRRGHDPQSPRRRRRRCLHPDAAALIAAGPVIAAFGGDLYGHTWHLGSSASYQPEDRIGLTVAGMTRVPEAADDVAMFLTALRLLAAHHRHAPRSADYPLEVTSQQMEAWLAGKGFHPDPAAIFRLKDILDHEPPTWHAGGGSDSDGWRLQLTNKIRGYLDVVEVEDYLRRVRTAADTARRSPVDRGLGDLADRIRTHLPNATKRVDQAVKGLQVVAGALTVLSTAAFFAAGRYQGAKDALTKDASEATLPFAILLVSASVGEANDPSGERRSCWPVWIAGLSIVLLVAIAIAPVFSRTGHPPPAGIGATAGALGLLISILAFGDRRGRPWIAALGLVTVAVIAVASFSTNDPSDFGRILVLLLIVVGLIATVTSLQHITLVIAEAPTPKANAVIVGTALALLVAIGAPLLYHAAGSGSAKSVQDVATAVAASIVASALFFAFSTSDQRRAERAESALAEELNRHAAETRRAERAEAALAEIGQHHQQQSTVTGLLRQLISNWLK